MTKLCVKDRVCDEVVCGRVVYDKVVCERVCMTKLCAKERRRRPGGQEAGRPGRIQNQKQEPHTKMWGKTWPTMAPPMSRLENYHGESHTSYDVQNRKESNYNVPRQHRAAMI